MFYKITNLKTMSKIKRIILAYTKMILSQVSFDNSLLQKEYTKAVHNLTASEKTTLNHWIKSKGLTPLFVKE